VLAVLVVSLVSLRKGNSLGSLEHDLGKAASIFEQGLIDEVEYGRIKGQILESYRYSRGSRINMLGAAWRGALLGLLTVSAILVLGVYGPAGYLLASLAAGTAGATVSGGGAAVVTYTQRQLAKRQLGDGHHSLIDAGSQPRV
jgi:hypothetical protein